MDVLKHNKDEGKEIDKLDKKVLDFLISFRGCIDICMWFFGNWFSLFGLSLFYSGKIIDENRTAFDRKSNSQRSAEFS